MDAKTFLFAALGNFAIPVSALVFFVLELLKIGRRKPFEETVPAESLTRLLMPTIVATAVIVIAAAAVLPLSRPTAAQFESIVARRVSEYEMARYRGPGLVSPTEPSWVIPAYSGQPIRTSSFNAVSIGIAWVLLWTAAAWAAAPRLAREAHRKPIELAVAVSTIATAIIVVCHISGTLSQLFRPPHVDEVEYLHAGYLMHGGLRLYRDFFEHHAPFLFQLLASLVPDGTTAIFPVVDLFSYIGRARQVVALMGTIGAVSAAWLSYRVSRWPGAPVIVLAALFTAPATWYRGIIDVRNDAPSLMLFWLGAALLLIQWRTPVRAALWSGIGIGLAFASALWNPKWPLACLVLGCIYLVRVWWSWKAGPGAFVCAILPPIAIAALTLFVLTRAATLADYSNFTIDFSMRIGDWFHANEHHRRTFFRTPFGLCPAIFKGVLPIIAAAIAIAFLLMRKWRDRLDGAQRWQLGAILALTVAALLEIRFVAPYPNVWTQFFLMYCFAMAVLYGVVAGMLVELLPQPARAIAGSAVVVIVTVIFFVIFAPRLQPVSNEYNIYYATASHMQKTLDPGDTVWLGASAHPIIAADAHYYWFGFNEHVAYALQAQKRGDAPAYLPRVAEPDLPPCKVYRGLDRHVRFVMAGGDIEALPLTKRCVRALIDTGRGLAAAPPSAEFVKIER